MPRPTTVELKRFFRFGLVGASTAAIYFSVLALHLEILKVNYNLAVTAAYVASVVFQFFANKHFTFASKETSVLRQLPRYAVLLAINYFLTILLVRLVVEKIGLTAYHGVLASVPLLMVVSYLLSKHWVFKKGYANE